MLYRYLVGALLLSLLCHQIGECRKSSDKSSGQRKSVKVLLNSKWLQTPLYLEVGEYLSEENTDYFWTYLDSLATEIGNQTLPTRPQSAQYEIAIRLAEKLLRSQAKVDILKLSLSLRYYSPRVTVFHQVIDEIISSNPLQNCDSFVELSHPKTETKKFTRYSCDLDQIEDSINYLTQQTPSDLVHPTLYSADHVFLNSYSAENPITVILYGSAGSEQFFQFHNYLKQKSVQAKLRYVVRYYYPALDSSKVALSGYGVELAIKSTEYKAQDDTRVRGEAVAQNDLPDSEQKPDEIAGFVFSKLKEKHSNLAGKLDDFRNYLIDNEKEIATLKVWELQEISMQAVTKIMSVQKDQSLTMLKDIAQNFPSLARSLVKINVEDELKREIVKNQQLFMQNFNLATGDTALFVNGIFNDVDSMDFFPLFDLVKQEFRIVNKLHSLLAGDNSRIRKFVKLDINWEKQDFQLDIRDASIQYINDMEQDKMYRNWPSNLRDFLRPTYPGMLRNIRRNMFHLVLVIDPSKKESFDIIRMAESFYIHKAPVRIGLVFAVERNESKIGYQDAGIACLEAFNYISQEKTPYEALSFLTDIIAYATSNGLRDVEPADVTNNFKAKWSHLGATVEDVFGPDSQYDSGRKLAWDFIDRTGLENGPKALLNGVLLKDAHLTSDQFEDAVLTELMKQTLPLQKAIYKGELADDDDILDYLMGQPTVMPRLNPIIFGTGSDSAKAQFIDVTSGTSLKNSDSVNYFTLNFDDLQATLFSSLKYINTKKDCNPVTVWLASDFISKASHNLLNDAVQHLYSSSKSMRLAFIFTEYNPTTRAMHAAQGSITSSQQLLIFMRKFSKHLIENENIQLNDILSMVPEDFKEKFTALYESTSNENGGLFPLHKAFSSRVLNLNGPNSNQFALVLNGKVFKVPFVNHNGGATIMEQDFSLMERFVTSMLSDKVMELLSTEERGLGVRKCSDLVFKLSSTMLAKTHSTKQRFDIKNVKEDHSVLELEPKFEDKPYVELTAMLDPLSRGAQKLAPILEVFHQAFNVKIKIYFNCVDKHSDMPLKLFYRFVLETELKFDQTGALVQPVAQFHSLPKTPLFTLGMAVPENWLVEAVEAIHDLDNIHLEEVSSNLVNAVFELEHLLVEGHCFEQSNGNPPRGLQFTLGTQANPTMVDTIVMANLGYFQLKANPGIWSLRLRQGRSEDIYSIVSHDAAEQTENNSEIIPVVASFRSNVIKIRVNKKPGKQNEELLYNSDSENGDGGNSLWDSWSWGSGNKEPSDATAKEADEDSNRINIFSLASGHLYERLLRIMMVSVLKNTQTPVKFWFLKNYLSPNFKNVLPFMAKKYNFEYELVEYKWPRWLHQQTEKQRIIWGYKILFLDVLFPLDVKKIIFVDADQVVRADLRELRDLDLEGAPYGYTPFCDSRTDMDGFRFWKSGYWATHLHGRKYHISALYVVDLQKFRRIAAGDRLRGQYQLLSQDPNSLSNLDQDLPNNMIHQVAIKSLPNEWLWCETWCDDASKKKAKTIDLCNNPKTKEPKLTSARRIVAEWQDYDNELKQMLAELNQRPKFSESKVPPPASDGGPYSHQEL